LRYITYAEGINLQPFKEKEMKITKKDMPMIFVGISLCLAMVVGFLHKTDSAVANLSLAAYVLVATASIYTIISTKHDIVFRILGIAMFGCLCGVTFFLGCATQEIPKGTTMMCGADWIIVGMLLLVAVGAGRLARYCK